MTADVRSSDLGEPSSVQSANFFSVFHETSSGLLQSFDGCGHQGTPSFRPCAGRFVWQWEAHLLEGMGLTCTKDYE